MAWWAWVVGGWAVASLAAALLLGVTGADIARRERRAAAAAALFPVDGDSSLPTGPAGASPAGPAASGVGTRRRVASSRPDAGSPPAGPLRDRVLATRASRRVSFQRHRLVRRPGVCAPPTAVRLGSEGRRAGRGSSVRPRHRVVDRRALPSTRLSPADRTRYRRLRATPGTVRSAALLVVPSASRRVRTPPAAAASRLGNPRVQRALLLSSLPVLALAPLLASSTSSLGLNEALAAELAAHPDQAHDLIAALDRGRVLAGLPIPVTAPAAPSTAAPSTAVPAAPRTTSAGSTPTAGPTSPTPPSAGPDGPTPARSGEPTRGTSPQRQAPENAPTTSTTPSEELPPSGPAVSPSPTSPAQPVPTVAPPATPSPTKPTPEPTPSPTPTPADPTPTPTPTDPPPTDPGPTDPGPVDPEPTAPDPTGAPDEASDGGPAGSPEQPGPGAANG